MVLSVSSSWLTGLWIASGILPLTICETRMTGSEICSFGKTSCAAWWIVSMKLWWEMVTSLSLEKTGMMQSSVRWESVASLVLASMNGRTLGCCTGITWNAGWTLAITGMNAGALLMVWILVSMIFWG